MTFPEYLEQQGFHAEACEATVHPDFFRLTERFWLALEKITTASYDRVSESQLKTIATEALKG